MSQVKKLVIVADDFGWTKGVNNGITKAYKDGIVTEISLMLHSPAIDHALGLIRSESFKDVGIHLSLLTEDRSFYKRDDYRDLFQEKSSEQIEEMATKEIGEFIKLVGKKPTHICPQYGIHGNLKLLKFIINYSQENNIPIRIPRTALSGNFDDNYAAEITLKRSQVKTTNFLFAHILGSDIEEIKNKFMKDLDEVGNNQTTELIFHPGYVDKELVGLTSLIYERARDLVILTDGDFQNKLNHKGFTLSSYSDL